MDKAKPFCIPKRAVWEAYKRVKANHGAAGVDGQSIADFEENLSGNLYKIWNRMCSGSYQPPPVLRVEIPKANGAGVRPLGIPTVADRIAQTVGKDYLEPILEAVFDVDSYGYRPHRSAQDAIAMARVRCWRNDWVLEFDIRAFFDNLNHDMLLRAIRHHTDCKWLLLYVERWLMAPVQLEDGSRMARDKGTPQGGVISPLLSNLFLHYVFDRWMRRQYPDIPFERYADDAICHCKTLEQAQQLLAALGERFAECCLELHPQKTRVVYCRDDDRRGQYPDQSFDFLGFTFRPRRSKNRWGKSFINFTPAVSNKSAKAMRSKMRGWGLHNRSDKSLDDLARMFNPVIQGWMNYFAKFYKSAMYPTLRHLNRYLIRWASRKYKKLYRHRQRAEHWLARIAQSQPGMFAHWRFVRPTTG
ncbi:MAG: group II intron reverse transcriptase/maturase [Gallionella sp.]